MREKKGVLLFLQYLVEKSCKFHPITLKEREVREENKFSQYLPKYTFLRKTFMNFAMARSSITLSDRQGIIDIPYRYLLTSVNSWVYFRLAAQSQVSYSTKKCL